MTRLLTRSVVRQCLEPDRLAEALRAAFVAYSRNRPTPPRRVGTPAGDGTAMVLVPGIATDVPAYTVKVHAKFPGSEPAIRGLVLLFDDSEGELLAALDSGYLTGVRTGVAAALATDALARADAREIAIVGAGTQGRHVLAALSDRRPVDRVTVYDTDPDAAKRYARWVEATLDIPVTASPSLEAAVESAGIVVTATWARTPFLTADLVGAGTHVTTLGADEPGKCEVASAVLETARVVVDDRALALESGAVGSVGLDGGAIAAELGTVLSGTGGRVHDEEVTVYAPVGLPLQDCVAAWEAYRTATEEDLGTIVDFLSEIAE